MTCHICEQNKKKKQRSLPDPLPLSSVAGRSIIVRIFASNRLCVCARISFENIFGVVVVCVQIILSISCSQVVTCQVAALQGDGYDGVVVRWQRQRQQQRCCPYEWIQWIVSLNITLQKEIVRYLGICCLTLWHFWSHRCDNYRSLQVSSVWVLFLDITSNTQIFWFWHL